MKREKLEKRQKEKTEQISQGNEREDSSNAKGPETSPIRDPSEVPDRVSYLGKSYVLLLFSQYTRFTFNCIVSCLRMKLQKLWVRTTLGVWL